MLQAEELEREVVDTLQKALKHCDVDTPGPRQPVYQFRAAIIQHRLASFYHNMYRKFDSDVDNNKKRTTLQLSKLYYEKAAKLQLSLEQTTEYLTIQMERVALAEYQARMSFFSGNLFFLSFNFHITRFYINLIFSDGTFNSKLKAYQTGLALILQCIPIIEILYERNNATRQKLEETIDNKIDNKIENGSAECKKMTQEQKPVDENPLDENQVEENLIILLEQRLQFLLRSLNQLFFKSPMYNKKEYVAFKFIMRFLKD